MNAESRATFSLLVGEDDFFQLSAAPIWQLGLVQKDRPLTSLFKVFSLSLLIMYLTQYVRCKVQSNIILFMVDKNL
jgi:hypothetical protein